MAVCWGSSLVHVGVPCTISDEAHEFVVDPPCKLTHTSAFLQLHAALEIPICLSVQYICCAQLATHNEVLWLLALDSEPTCASLANAGCILHCLHVSYPLQCWEAGVGAGVCSRLSGGSAAQTKFQGLSITQTNRLSNKSAAPLPGLHFNVGFEVDKKDAVCLKKNHYNSLDSRHKKKDHPVKDGLQQIHQQRGC